MERPKCPACGSYSIPCNPLFHFDVEHGATVVEFCIVKRDNKVLLVANGDSGPQIELDLPVPFNYDSERTLSSVWDTWDNLSLGFTIRERQKERVVIEVTINRQEGYWYYGSLDESRPSVNTTKKKLTVDCGKSYFPFDHLYCFFKNQDEEVITIYQRLYHVVWEDYVDDQSHSIDIPVPSSEDPKSVARAFLTDYVGEYKFGIEVLKEIKWVAVKDKVPQNQSEEVIVTHKLYYVVWKKLMTRASYAMTIPVPNDEDLKSVIRECLTEYVGENNFFVESIKEITAGFTIPSSFPLAPSADFRLTKKERALKALEPEDKEVRHWRIEVGPCFQGGPGDGSDASFDIIEFSGTEKEMREEGVRLCQVWRGRYPEGYDPDLGHFEVGWSYTIPSLLEE